MKRKIIEIDEEKCNGCGLCVEACHEGALQMIDGKAVLVSDEYCDGLGDCLPDCPTDAIRIIEREAEPFNEESVKKRQAELKALKEKASEQAEQQKQDEKPVPCGCPGTRAAMLKKKEKSFEAVSGKAESQNNAQNAGEQPSELTQWPIQINLVNPNSSFLQDADLLIAADCTAFAYGAFHRDFMKDKITMIGCPKLDDNQYYTEKFTEILKNNNLKSITVARMTVPCCSGIIQAVKQAMLNSQTIIPYKEVIISPEGEIVSQ